MNADRNTVLIAVVRLFISKLKAYNKNINEARITEGLKPVKTAYAIIRNTKTTDCKRGLFLSKRDNKKAPTP